MAKTGYVNGSDILLMIGGVAIGHCTSHKATFSSETKERAVKPVASEAVSSAGLFKGKGVTALSISLSGEGLRFCDETEYGFKELLAAWYAGESITCQCTERIATTDETVDPYLVGNFVITSLEESAPAQDDATYTVELENDGAPTTLDTSKITSGTAA